MDAVSLVEYVTKALAIVEASVSDGSLDIAVGLVSQGDQELASGEGVELVISPLLSEGRGGDVVGASGGVDGLHELVNVVVGVEAAPHAFSVEGVVAATEALLGAVVEEGDASGGEGEGEGALEESLVVSAVEESGVVVVVHEEAEGVDVSELGGLFVPSIGNTSHGLAVHEGVLDGEVHGVVEEACQVVLVVAYVGRVAVEDLAHLEDASCLTELRPEILGHLRDGVDSDAVEGVLVNKILDPALQVGTHVGVALIKVGEACEAAVFHLPLVVPVVNVTVLVVVFLLVQGVDLAEVVAYRGNMVGDHVYHYPDVSLMALADEVLEGGLVSEVLVEPFPVLGPVAVVAAVQVVHYGGDPDGVEAQVLDVVQVLHDAVIGTSAVVVQVAAGGVSIGSGESVGQKLVHSALLPGGSVSSGGEGRETSDQEAYQGCLHI